MTPGASRGLSEPPEGVLAGESVPRENEEDERYRTELETIANTLKGIPAYAHLSESELRSVAREKFMED